MAGLSLAGMTLPNVTRFLPGLARDYTEERIRGSHDFVASVLEHCTTMGSGLAVDVGSGAGFESFALREHFAQVLAIDTSRRSIHEARRLRQRLGGAGLTFRVGDASTLEFPQSADLVWCNLMSHNVSSRLGLLRHLRAGMLDGAWLMYSEEVQGYPLRELSAAVEHRDRRAARARARQLLAGILGASALRFFVVGSSIPILDALGFRVARTEIGAWHGVPTVERVWAVVERDATDTVGVDADYLTVIPELEALRRRVTRTSVKKRAEKGLTAQGAVRDVSHLAAFATAAEIADAVLPAPSVSLSRAGRLRERLPPPVGPRSPDWSKAHDAVRATLAALAVVRSGGNGN